MSRTNEKRTTIHKYEDANVLINYVWANDDELIDWNDEVDDLLRAYLHAKVRVDLLEFTENFEALDKTVDFQAFQLYINGEFLGQLANIEEKEITHGPLVICTVIVGAG